MKQRLIVVGCGVMGAATADYATRLGADVTILEADAAGNSMAASSDYSKIFRYSYAGQREYVVWAKEAGRLWRDLELESGASLLHQVGLLLLDSGAGGFALDSYATLRDMGERVELLEPDQLALRYPQFAAARLQGAVLDPNGGILAANRCVETLWHSAVSKGARYLPGQRVSAVEQRGDEVIVSVQGGQRYIADAVVLAVNGWINRLLGVDWVRNTRQPVLYYRPLGDRSHYLPRNFPVFADLDSGFYGFPSFGLDAVKVADHSLGPTVDPNHRDWYANDEADAGARGFLSRYIPALGDAELVKTHVCFYDNTPDGNFILDRLPGLANVVVAAGFSGHGFKFAPLVGKVLANLALKDEVVLPLDSFSLSRFATATSDP